MAMETDSDEVEKVLQRLANESSSSAFHTDDGDDDYNGSKVEELLRQIEQEKDTTGGGGEDQHMETSIPSGGSGGGSGDGDGGIGAGVGTSSSTYDGEGESSDVIVVAKPPVARAKKTNGKLVVGDKPAPPRKKSPPRDDIPKPWKKKGAIRKKADDNDDIFMVSTKDSAETLQDTPHIGDDGASASLTSPSESSKHDFAPSSTLSRSPPESPSAAAVAAVRVQTPTEPIHNGIPHDSDDHAHVPSSPHREPPTSSTPPPSSPTPSNTTTQPNFTPPKQVTDTLPTRQATPPQTAIPAHSSTPTRSSPRSTPTPPPSSSTPPPHTESHPQQQESQPTQSNKKKKKLQAAAEDVLLDDAVTDEAPVFSKNDFSVLKTQILKQVTEETAILAQEFQELKTKYEEEIRGKSRLKAVLSDYEKTIAKLIDDASSGHHEGVSDRIVELENDNKRKTGEYEVIFSAHAELKARYESAKADNEKLKSNEQVQKETISKLQNELQGSETRFRALQTHAESKLDNASEQLVKLRDERAKEVAAIQARMQKAEARTAALEKENKELLAIADDLMGKIEKNQ